jgi:2-amino-4-hydroxy-6-hydroxymethyldihydropteridine diphosphokinase
MRAYVSVGSNLGDRRGYLALAARELRAVPGLSVLRASGVYETEPLGPPGQGRYLNAALEVETTLPPVELLRCLLRVEAIAHRRRAARWGPRTLDLDLLLYDDLELRTPELTLPHPGLPSRRFVLEPLAELCPDRPVPGNAATVGELCRRAPRHPVTRVGLYPL